MTDITVKDFSKIIGLPVARLIDQLELAGIEKKKENDLISDEEKMQLLDYVRNNQHSSSLKDKEESISDNDSSEISKDLDKQKTKTTIRKKKVFSKKNNQVTEKLDPKEKNVDIDITPIESDQEEESIILNANNEEQAITDSPDNVDLNKDNSLLSSNLIKKNWVDIIKIKGKISYKTDGRLSKVNKIG